MKSINLSNKQFRQVREALIRNNYNLDNAYQQLMCELNLFGFAFFGWHCANPYKRMLINHFWRACIFVKLEDGKIEREYLIKQSKEFLGIEVEE